MNGEQKITPKHLSRRAVVYLRQSSEAGIASASAARRWTAGSPLGMQASLAALEQLDAQEDGHRQALVRQLEQLEYEATRACEQYNEVDPRNRLVASELERRWNVKLEEVARVRASLAEVSARQPPSAEERAALTALGERFSDVWNHPACSVELKKQIVRTVIEEVLVDEEPPDTLSFIVHWKGGSHTAFAMEKANPKTMCRTAEGDLEVIRKMALRYGDDNIARVLNKPWSRLSVKTARHTLVDADVLTLQGAARYTGTSDTTIKKLVDAGVLAGSRQCRSRRGRSSALTSTTSWCERSSTG